MLRSDHVFGKPSTDGGNGSVTCAREVTRRLWSGGRLGSPLSSMGVGKAAERGSFCHAHVGTGPKTPSYSSIRVR